MNRFKAIFFLVCFLIANSGIAISAHWCGGKLTHISFLFEHDACACGKKEVEMKTGCCKDKIAMLKAADNLKTSTIQIFKTSISKDITVLHPPFGIMEASFLHHYTPSLYWPPPGKPKLPKYVLNRAFLI